MELRNKEAKIIILSGKARSGKDTSMEIMKSIYESEGKKVINLSYAPVTFLFELLKFELEIHINPFGLIFLCLQKN